MAYKSKKFKDLFTSQYTDIDWAELVKPLGLEVKIFNGFINRLIQEKDNSYLIESKCIDTESFDIETGWFSFSGLNPIIPEAKKLYKYAFQPYIPGNAISVAYLDLCEPNTKWPMKVKLHVKVENNKYTEETNNA